MPSANSTSARYFAPAEKARAEAMVHNLIAAFARRIDRLDWMAPETKAKAKAKLAVLKIGVGYPDTGSTTPRWTSARAMRSATLCAPSSSRHAQTSPSSASPSTVPSGS